MYTIFHSLTIPLYESLSCPFQLRIAHVMNPSAFLFSIMLQHGNMRKQIVKWYQKSLIKLIR